MDLNWTGLKGATIFNAIGRRREKVVVPLHKRDLPKGTLLEILKQAGISRDELRDLL